MLLLRVISILGLLLCIQPIAGEELRKHRLSDVLDYYAAKHHVMISYQPKVCNRILIKDLSPEMGLDELASLVEKQSKMRIGMVSSGHYYVYKHKSQICTMTGKVTDADTGEALVGAQIKLHSGSAYETGEFGLYSLSLEKGKHSLFVSYPGFTDCVMDLEVDSSGIYNIPLVPLNQKLQEVEVYGDVSNTSLYTDGGKIEIFLPNDASVASRMGKKNALSILESMPGVTPGNVGKGDLFVRGGNTGCNGFYVDGAPVYSVNHLYGVNTVFNTNAIDKIEMYRGNIPSRYGNYTGSITEFFLKNGNIYSHTGEYTAGNFMSDVILQGPVVKEKSSYIVSLRYAYPNLYSKLLSKDNYAGFTFADVYAKLNFTLKGQNRFYLSFFYAGDAAQLNNDNAMELDLGLPNLFIDRRMYLKWSNLMFSLRWNKIASEKLFFNTTLYYSSYSYQTKEVQSEYVVSPEDYYIKMSGVGRFYSRIDDYGLSFYGKWFPNSTHQVRFGMVLSAKKLRPADYGFKGKIFTDPNDHYMIPDEVGIYWGNIRANPLELSIYGEDEIRFGKQSSLLWGIRGSSYFSRSNTFAGVFPFLQFRYLFSNKLSAYMGYSSAMQTIFMLPSTSILYSFGSSVWIPITQNMKAEYSEVLDASIAYRLADFSLATSCFFRHKKHTMLWNMYQRSTGFFNRDWYYQGDGISYGAEVLLTTQLKKHNFRFAYTLGYSKERAPGFYENEWHRAANDVRHSVDISVNRFFLSGKIEVGAMWSFRSGSPYTQVQVRQVLNENGELFNVEDYSFRNNAQFRNTHYLNLNLNYHFQFARQIKSTLSTGVYNVYYRQNPYEYEKLYDRKVVPVQIKGYREISIAPIIPYFSLTIKL